MNFLKTLFWVVLAVLAAIFATANWTDVTVVLWGGLAADIKLPALLALAMLLGAVPTYLILKGQVWALRRRLTVVDRTPVEPVAAPPPPPNPLAPAERAE